MNHLTTFQIVSLLLTAVSCALAGAAFYRSGKWRSSDAGKVMTQDVAQMKTDIISLDFRMAAAEQTGAKIVVLTDKMARVETQLEHTARRSDIEAIKGELGGVETIGRNTQAAVARIENFLREASR